ncbi:MAG: 3-deoxy-D-manno-octulosonic acid transferase [Bacteroidaceae bacterium]|nr:3-deoxy-D-manno-octulosonic acid transferase [Bacteroidaceae bacterium]
MMYNFAINLYSFGAKVDSLFSKKVKTMLDGQKATFQILREKIDPNRRYLWFHAASLGEFEQGRPLMERIRKEYPSYGILLTFFSPSGYEVRKNYEGADVICYLPFDKPKLVKQFMDLANPCMAFFIKYEFWKNYLTELHRRQVPTYSVSSIFRPDQVFFKDYGKDYGKVLCHFDHLFVQNQLSKDLLDSVGIKHVTIVGDTRFDRVIQIRQQAKELPLVEQFKQQQLTFVAGSSWQPDEDLFIEYFNRHPEVKLIIAPHVIGEDHLQQIIGKVQGKVVRYTQATMENVKDARCLIIDCFGLLSSIYRYGEIAYVGGGFGTGIHNTVEAAVYGVPVIFGPNHQRFMEAKDLITCGGAFAVNGADDLNAVLDRLLTDKAFLQEAGQKAGTYVSGRAGATDKVWEHIKGLL